MGEVDPPGALKAYGGRHVLLSTPNAPPRPTVWLEVSDAAALQERITATEAERDRAIRERDQYRLTLRAIANSVPLALMASGTRQPHPWETCPCRVCYLVRAARKALAVSDRG